MPLGLVAIVGAPNVGKSTLFNRMVGERSSIVEDVPGVTRDRLYGKGEWLTKEFQIVDTGGIEIKNAPFQQEIRAQAEIAMEEADVILFVVDGKTGVTEDDRAVAKILYKTSKPVLLVVNKIDNKDRLADAYEFYALGLGDPYPVSGSHGIGVGDLLDKVISLLPEKEEEVKGDAVSFCFIGRPNVGKSSLTNAILGETRTIVKDIAGTTRDSIDTPFTYNDKNYVAIDTAGLVKRGRIYEAIDKYSAIRALKAIERSEIVLLVLDGEKGILEQDKHVIQYATDLHKAIIIVVNKWDLVDKDTNTMSSFTKEIRKEYKFLDYAPIVYLSALTRKRIDTLFEALDLVHEAYHTRIKTSLLNDVLQEAQVMNQAPDFNGGRLKIYYATQVLTCPPTITLVVNDPNFMHFSYQRYLENRLRETFNFDGTPIKFSLKRHSKKDD